MVQALIASDDVDDYTDVVRDIIYVHSMIIYYRLTIFFITFPFTIFIIFLVNRDLSFSFAVERTEAGAGNGIKIEVCI